MRALLIPGDYDEVAFVPWKGTLDELYEMFSCKTIEVIITPIPGLIMLVDEDARLTNRPPNHKAMMFYPGAVFGPAILTYAEERESDKGNDLHFKGVPDKFDWKLVAESSYQRIVASLGEHPVVTVEGQ